MKILSSPPGPKRHLGQPEDDFGINYAKEQSHGLKAHEGNNTPVDIPCRYLGGGAAPFTKKMA